jgi:hypothetical protein
MGDRPYFWSKDLSVAIRDDEIPENALYTMIDVDYHIDDLPELLVKVGKPTFIYTVIPTAAASHVGENHICFTADNKIKVTVSGGAEYHHHLWHYRGDCIAATTWWGLKTTMFLLEKRHISDFQAVVCLVPFITFYGPCAWLARKLHANSLERFRPVVGDIVHFTVQSKERSVVTIGMVDGFASCTIDAGTFEAACLAAKNSTQPANLSMVRSWLSSLPDDQQRQASTYLLEYMASKCPPKRPHVTPSRFARLTYSANIVEAGDRPERDSMLPFMCPLDNRGYNPTTDPANAVWAVNSRIIGLQNAQANLQRPRPALNKSMERFVTFTVRATGNLRPIEVSEVLERQTTSTRRNAIIRATPYGTDTHGEVTSFLKKECYSEIKDPRVITQFNPSVKLQYSRFILPYGDALCEHCPWYAFRKPIEIAQRIHDVVINCSHVLVTDYSRFDGTISVFMREMLDHPLLVRLFSSDRDEVSSIYLKQFGGWARMGEVRYMNGTNQSSGSVDTSALNTTRNAAIKFCALVMYGFDYATSWTILNQHVVTGGDDGIIAVPYGVDAERLVTCLNSVAKAFGLRLELETIPRGRPFQFLSRWFCPWDGSLSSMCDLPRQMSKFHMTPVLPMRPEDKLREKALSFYLTDSNTPIMGPFVRYCLEWLTLDPELPYDLDTRLCSWWARYDKTVQFPNDHEAWMDDVVQATYSEFNQAWLLEAIQDGRNPLQFPCCRDQDEQPPSKSRYVMSGDVHQSSKHAISERLEDQHYAGDRTAIKSAITRGSVAAATESVPTPSPTATNGVRTSRGHQRPQTVAPATARRNESTTSGKQTAPVHGTQPRAQAARPRDEPRGERNGGSARGGAKAASPRERAPAPAAPLVAAQVPAAQQPTPSDNVVTAAPAEAAPVVEPRAQRRRQRQKRRPAMQDNLLSDEMQRRHGSEKRQAR